MGQLVFGYLDFAESQAEREQVMTMKDWAEHLDCILMMSGEQLLQKMEVSLISKPLIRQQMNIKQELSAM